jgi:hypothetical protein
VSATFNGDPYVMLMFLRHHDRVLEAIQKQGLDPQEALKAEGSAAQVFNLSPADFRAISPVYQATKKQLDALDAQGAAYVEQAVARKQQPDAAVLQGFSTQYAGILQSGIANLQNAMSPAGWTALQTYIASHFQSKINRSRPK